MSGKSKREMEMEKDIQSFKEGSLGRSVVLRQSTTMLGFDEESIGTDNKSIGGVGTDNKSVGGASRVSKFSSSSKAKPRKTIVKLLRRGKKDKLTRQKTTEYSDTREIAFLSREVRCILSRDSHVHVPKIPSVMGSLGVVLFVDISGFTAKGQKLRDDFTAETATELLAGEIFAALERLTEICLHWGGDVAKFAGDALICVWKVDETVYGASPTVQTALKQARRAAYEMQRAMMDKEFDGLQLHGGIGAGAVLNFHLGDIDERDNQASSRWHLVTGSACVIANSLLEMSQKGEILYYTGDADSSKPESITASTVVTNSDLFMQGLDGFDAPLNLGEWSGKLIPELVKLYIPRALRSKLSGGGLEGGEVHQRIGIMFVGAEYLQLTEEELTQHAVPETKLKHLNNMYRSLTRVVHEYGGEIRDLLFDDKGCVFIAVFGAHSVIELPELKCMRAAIKIGVNHERVKIGVDVGKCFTGMCGTKERNDFVVMGHEVNMASRLMNGADIGQLIASPKIMQAATGFMSFERVLIPHYKHRPVQLEDGTSELQLVKVDEFEGYVTDKNVIKRTASFIATFRTDMYKSTAAGNEVNTLMGPPTPLVGRELELNAVYDYILENNREDRSGVCLVLGEEGIGKSAFVKQIRTNVKSIDEVIFTAAFAIEEGTKYFTARQLVNSILGLENKTNEKNQDQVAARLKELGLRYDQVVMTHMFPEIPRHYRASIMRMQHLLQESIEKSDLLIDDPAAKNVNGVSKKHQRLVKKFIINLIAKYQQASSKGLVIIVEDIQWIDEYSLGLLQELNEDQDLERVTFIMTTRPLSEIRGESIEKLNPFFEAFKGSDRNLQVTIDPLTREESDELTLGMLRSYNMDVSDKSIKEGQEPAKVDESVLKLVYERTKGHPNHLILLVKWFMESRNVVYNKDMRYYRFPNTTSALQARLKLPATLRELIVSRLDYLTDGDARRILKVASVIGPQFSEKLLLAVLHKDNINLTEDELKFTLDGLAALGFIELGSNFDEPIDGPGGKPRDGRAASYNSVDNPRLHPRLRHKMKRYLDQSTDQWSFTAEVTQQAIKSLIPTARYHEIEDLMEDVMTKKGKLFKFRRKGRKKLFS